MNNIQTDLKLGHATAIKNIAQYELTAIALLMLSCLILSRFVIDQML